MPAQELPRLAGMLAHEIRNPLASATTNLAVACDLMEPSDPRAPFLRRAEIDLDRIGELISACLGLATAGRVRREITQIGPLLCDVLARCGEQHASASIECEIPESLQFAVDSGLLVRCLENLVENAVRESGAADGRILIEALPAPSGLTIAVEDSGPGVPETKREEIFEAFVSGGQGSGLGLSFVRLVAEAHGGTAKAVEAPGGGARFELFLATPETGS